jgi:hypothetical protein
LYGSLQKTSILMLKIFINTEFDFKKKITENLGRFR